MSTFDDDLARGCLPTGEPLECLYGTGWWTEMPEEEPESVDLHIAELEARIAKLRWVPVSDRLPEDLQSIIVFTKDRKTYIIRFLELYGREGFGALSDIVTHWMPMPTLPEVQE